MATFRSYTTSTQFDDGINSDLLKIEIAASSVSRALVSVSSDATTELYFDGELTGGDETEIDTVTAAHDPTGYRIKRELKRMIYPTAETSIALTISTSGLVITIDITDIIVNDQTTLVASSTDIKQVLACFIHNKASDAFSILVREYTTGSYAALGADETTVQVLGEWTIAIDGTTMVEV